MIVNDNRRKIPYAYETILLNGSVSGLNSSVYNTENGYEIYEATITIEGGSIYFMVNVDVPNPPSIGHKVNEGSFIVLETFSEIKNFKAINLSTNVMLKVSYFNRKVLND